MTHSKHSPLPWELNADSGIIYGQVSGDDDETPFCCDVAHDGMSFNGVLSDTEKANADLIVNSVNAIGAMAAHLGCNPVELAERMAAGDGVALIQALQGALLWQIDEAISHKKQYGEEMRPFIEGKNTLNRLKGENKI